MHIPYGSLAQLYKVSLAWPDRYFFTPCTEKIAVWPRETSLRFVRSLACSDRFFSSFDVWVRGQTAFVSFDVWALTHQKKTAEDIDTGKQVSKRATKMIYY